MLSFFNRQPKLTGQIWENFFYLSKNSLEKVESDYNKGLTRGHTLEIIRTQLNKPKEYFNYEAYEYTCDKNDGFEAKNNLKRVIYINENPINEDGYNVGYGEISINKLPKYTEDDELDLIEDFLRTFEKALSMRSRIFYKYGVDWVKATLMQLKNPEMVSNRLVSLLRSEKEGVFRDCFIYLLESKFELRKQLELVVDNQSWMY